MNTKYTPGPWATTAIYTKGKLTHWGINGVNHSGDTLTSGRIVDVRVYVPNHDCLTQEANAQLIAAAPELLEALEQMVSAMWQHFEYHHDGDDNCGSEYPQKALEQARAAIAKVKGEQ